MNILTYLGFDHPAVKLWLRAQAARRRCQLKCGPYAWDLVKGPQVIRITRNQFAGVPQLAADFDLIFELLTPSRAGNSVLLDFSRVHVHTYRESGLSFELAQWPGRDAPIDAYFENYRPSEHDLIFDLGADCGVSTYVMAQFSGKVVAFDPDAGLRSILERNVQRHALANVTVAKDSLHSMGGLIRHYGQPAFCKINLDHVRPEFLLGEAAAWSSQAISFAAYGSSRRVRSRFVALLKKAGFEVQVAAAVGMIWARSGDRWQGI